MVEIFSEQVLFVDIDETLVLRQKLKKHYKSICITCPYTHKLEWFRVHEPHLKIIRDRQARGATIVFWSAAGHRWAARVAKALKLDNASSLAISKPVGYVDDKKCTKFMGEHIYLSPDDAYK